MKSLVEETLEREAASMRRWQGMTDQDRHALIERVQAHLVRLETTMENWLPATCGAKDTDPLVIILDVSVGANARSSFETMRPRTPLHDEARSVLRDVAIEGILEVVSE